MTRLAELRDGAYGGTRSAVYRFRRYAGKYGWRSLPRRIGQAVREAVVFDESHIWLEYRLDDAEAEPLPPGFIMREITVDEAALIEALPSVSLREARRRMERGGRLCMTLDGDRPMCATWWLTTLGVLGAPGGEVTAPPRTAFLEDTVTNPEYRKQRVAHVMFSRLAVQMRGEGLSAILGHVAVTNRPAQVAARQFGFIENGLTHFRRVLGFGRIEMTDVKGPIAEDLARQLNSHGRGVLRSRSSRPGAGRPSPDNLEPGRVRL